MIILDPMIVGILGTSLSTGRLSANWVPELQRQALQQPECVGPLTILNMGRGSQTSDWGVTQAPVIAAQNPTHALIEGFGINDSVVTLGVPAVSQANHIANIVNIIATFRAARADVDITIQTMNPVSAGGAALRPNLAAYYADELTTAAAQSCRALDNYGGVGIPVPPGVATGWPKPLPLHFTYDSDGLHPKWTDAVENYLFPNVLFWLRQRMAEFWGLPAPTPPPSPAPLTVTVEMVAGGGGGGGRFGGGGGAGGSPPPATITLTDYRERIVTVGTGGLGAPGGDESGDPGKDSTFYELIAYGGGEGGGFGTTPVSDGGDGGSGGGAAGYTGPGVVGDGVAGQGNNGGLSAGSSQGPGGGGGKGGVGSPGVGINGGDGGPGAISASPLPPTTRIAPGGPAGRLTGAPGAYAAGYSATDPGAGGAGGVGGNGQPGNSGKVSIWYAGPQRAEGGIVSSYGGFTIHTYFATGTFKLT